MLMSKLFVLFSEDKIWKHKAVDTVSGPQPVLNFTHYWVLQFKDELLALWNFVFYRSEVSYKAYSLQSIVDVEHGR